MITTDCRKPTLDEAVGLILKLKDTSTRSWRRAQLDDWRAEYGDEFADQVEARVKAAWKGKK